MSIRLHNKYGLAPTLPVCQWCGKDTGEIALLGAAWRGECEPPMHMVLSDQPCDTCRAVMAKGITFIEAEMHRGTPERTGRWAVVTEDTARRIIKDTPLLDAVLKQRKCMVDKEVYEMLVGAKDAEGE